MRPVSRVSTTNKSSQRPVSAQVARRRDLRRQRRQTLLLQLWRFVALLLLSGGFSWILLRHGWTLRSPEAVILTGGAAIETNQVIEAAKLRFPSPPTGGQSEGAGTTAGRGLTGSQRSRAAPDVPRSPRHQPEAGDSHRTR